MKRSGFKRPVYEAPPPAPPTKGRTVIMGGTTLAAVPKVETLQHAGYMRIVRTLSCAHCGLPGPSQFCHSDETKGTGIKSDCRKGWPGCPKCHHDIGTARIYPKDERRKMEAYMSAATRKRVLAAKLWPASLPLWPDDIEPTEDQWLAALGPCDK